MIKKLRHLWLVLQQLWLIRIAAIVVDQNCNNCVWSELRQLRFLRQLRLVLRQLWTLRQLWSNLSYKVFLLCMNESIIRNFTLRALFNFDQQTSMKYLNIQAQWKIDFCCWLYYCKKTNCFVLWMKILMNSQPFLYHLRIITGQNEIIPQKAMATCLDLLFFLSANPAQLPAWKLHPK
mgnify:CR=1 FL=1